MVLPGPSFGSRVCVCCCAWLGRSFAECPCLWGLGMLRLGNLGIQVAPNHFELFRQGSSTQADLLLCSGASAFFGGAALCPGTIWGPGLCCWALPFNRSEPARYSDSPNNKVAKYWDFRARLRGWKFEVPHPFGSPIGWQAWEKTRTLWILSRFPHSPFYSPSRSLTGGQTNRLTNG